MLCLEGALARVYSKGAADYILDGRACLLVENDWYPVD